MITLKDYLTSSGKFPDREKHPEVTDLVRGNANNLLIKVNGLLLALGIKDVEVSSGFRPSSVNAALKNSAKKSLHMQGKAIDIADPTGKLKQKVLDKSELLKKFNLWMEDPTAAPTWLHLDDSTSRKDRPLRVFLP